MEKKIDMEQIAMNLIANSGDARSYCFQALAKAKQKNYEEADALMQQANASSLLAHKCQTGLLVQEATGVHSAVSVLLVHAQDHLMSSLLAQELIKEIIILHKEKQDK